MTLRIVAELQPAPLAKRSEIVREPTGSPVRKCSLMIADSTARPRASGVQSACVGNVEARIAIYFKSGERGFGDSGIRRGAFRDAAKTILKLFTAAAET